MTLLNEFLKTISMRADDNEELHSILREFLEPDTNDKKIHGGAVIRTVNLIRANNTVSVELCNTFNLDNIDSNLLQLSNHSSRSYYWLRLPPTQHKMKKVKRKFID